MFLYKFVFQKRIMTTSFLSAHVCVCLRFGKCSSGVNEAGIDDFDMFFTVLWIGSNKNESPAGELCGLSNEKKYRSDKLGA